MTEGVYCEELRLLHRDVDMFRRLRLSRLFELLQEASIAHTCAMGMGRDKTLDRGLLWVLTRQWVDISRLPVYDEPVRICTWPGRTMHLFFPRQYKVETLDGETLLRGSALWMLMDAKERHFIFPEKYGIKVEAVTTGEEVALPPPPKPLPLEREMRFTVPFSYADMNGHMNNTRYFDLADDCLGVAIQGREPRRAVIEYKNEARAGEELTLRWGGDGERCFLTGDGAKKTFSLSLEYNQ